jgi:DNA (cytosine-5)-methyltransferase 1
VKPRALDLFCGAGGASMGLHRAGFDVTGVDIKPQPRYPFTFILADALTVPLDGYDFIWASPPCQAYTWAGKRWDVPRVDLLDSTRRRLQTSGTPFVIENVVGAPLQRDFLLCGEMFHGLGVIRHRYFEVGNGFACIAPAHTGHLRPITNGTGLQRSAYACVAGHGGEGYTYRLEDWRAAMGIDWMTKDELVEAIPPAYSEFIGKQALQFIQQQVGVL